MTLYHISLSGSELKPANLGSGSGGDLPTPNTCIRTRILTHVAPCQAFDPFVKSKTFHLSASKRSKCVSFCQSIFTAEVIRRYRGTGGSPLSSGRLSLEFDETHCGFPCHPAPESNTSDHSCVLFPTSLQVDQMFLLRCPRLVTMSRVMGNG